MNHDDNALLIEYLTEQGYPWTEIENVLEKLQEYERRVHRESVFDSIASGSFDLESLLKELKHDQ